MGQQLVHQIVRVVAQGPVTDVYGRLSWGGCMTQESSRGSVMCVVDNLMMSDMLVG
jgi:hypothetical protein